MTDPLEAFDARLTGKTAAAMFLLAAARTEKNRGEFDKALALFQKALPGFSDNESDFSICGLIYMELAETLEALNRPADAAQYNGRALQVIRELAST
ncbi:MAG TPA: hypothetical protein V6C97_20100 [Oculatellaceae cyanobacterium]